MKYDWNTEKNQWLLKNRNISFEEILHLMDNGYLRIVLKHPVKQNQKIFIVERDGYAYNVPFVESDDNICFLKTIYPSRVSTKKYLGEK